MLFLGTLLMACPVADSASATAALQRYQFTEPHMGTVMQITLYAEDEEAAKTAAGAAFQRIQELNLLLSDYNPESELMRLARRPAGTPVEVSHDLFHILSRAQEVSEETDGGFDATLGPLVRLWREAQRSGRLPHEAAIDQAQKQTGYQKLRLDRSRRTVTLMAPGMQPDLGGIAKGYAADEALKVLQARGITRALVAAAGDIAVGDPPPETEGWRIGIASIDAGPSGMTETIRLSNAAISTSGDTEQFVEIDGRRYSHIVNPKTGVGLTERIGVTVLAPDATSADALSTAISVMGSKKGIALVEALTGVETLIVKEGESGREILVSSGFPAMPDETLPARRLNLR